MFSSLQVNIVGNALTVCRRLVDEVPGHIRLELKTRSTTRQAMTWFKLIVALHCKEPVRAQIINIQSQGGGPNMKEREQVSVS